METVIREGALRILTTESSCDVILSCQGRRLMAHKVILSIVSPVFRELLAGHTTDPTVIILPDTSSHTMALILDYIYTGSAIVYSNSIKQFLSLVEFLKIKLDTESLKIPTNYQKIEEKQESKSEEVQDAFYKTEELKSECYDIKKKILPELIPIHKIRSIEKLRNRHKMSCVLPSPWKSRETVYGDPRDDIVENSEYLTATYPYHVKVYKNDSNNNFQCPMGVRYSHQPNFPRKEKVFQFDPISPLDKIFPKSHETQKIHNGVLDITVPPEDVDIDRDKIDYKERPVKHTKAYQTSEQLNLYFQNTKLPIREIQNSPCRSSSGEDFKEDSSGSVKNFERITVSDRKTETNFCKRESEVKPSDKQKPFKCEQCGKCFSQLRNFKYHRSVHEGTKEFAAKCSECGKVFNDKGYLSSHMKIHRDKKEYACPHCPKRFNQRVAYNMHTRIHTGVKPHECSSCGKSFSRKMLLKQHQRVHTGERPYSCPECGKTFADRSNMSLHARLHTGVKPYSCNLCPKSFTKKHHLKTHMNFHTGLKPYSCEKCGLAFSQSSNMRTHYKKCLLRSQNSESERQNEEEEQHSS